MTMYVRLYGKVECNRPIDFEKGDYFSPGGYEIEIDGDEIKFDFLDSDFGTETKKSQNIITWEQRNFDEELARMSVNDFCQKLIAGGVDQVREFFIYSGENEDPEYQINDVICAGIEVVDDNGDIHEFDITQKARICRFRQTIRRKTENEMREYFDRMMKMEKIELWHQAFAIDSKQRIADYLKNEAEYNYEFDAGEKDTADFLKWISETATVNFLYDCYLDMEDACICTSDAINEMVQLVYRSTKEN